MAEKLRILCVDDEKQILNVVRRQLEDEDYELITADSASEGLKVLKNCAPVSIILSDYRMPGVNGVEFLKKASDFCSDHVGIIFSGYTDSDTIKEYINSGLVFRYLNKPWGADELLSAIKDAEIKLKSERRDEL